MNIRLNHSVFYLGLTLALLVGSVVQAESQAPTAKNSVSFVCERGAVKSLMAASLFDQEAEKRGLPYRALSRGINPYDVVPGKIATALTEDGFDVAGFVPQKLSSEDVAGSTRLVAIGVDLSTYAADGTAPVLQWDDVPPASVDYEASKATLLAHIQDLLDGLDESAE